jgi:nucleolar protein 16
LIYAELERLAASGVQLERFTSTGEKGYLDRLVTKYGSDVEAMARDRRLNPEQKTVGELNRAIRKAGGLGRLGMVAA